MFELLSLPEEDGRRILLHDDSNVIRRRFLEIWEEVVGTFRSEDGLSNLIPSVKRGSLVSVCTGEQHP